jgi:hypothetical protein
MTVDREGFLAAVAAPGLFAPGLSACDATEYEGADGGLGGSAGTGGENAGGDIGGGLPGGAIAGGAGGGGGTGETGGAGGMECGSDCFIVNVVWGEEVTDGPQVGFVCGTATGYKVGFAETGARDDGWYGEDCLPGEKSGFDLCHTISADGANFSSVATPDEIVEGETTLLRAELARNATWVVISADDASKCWVGGHDPSYYDELGCTPADELSCITDE